MMIARLFGSIYSNPLESFRLSQLLSWAFLVRLCGFWVFWRVLIIIQRLFFHPLSSFPGPKIAGASTIYRMYYSIWRDGEMFAQTKILHERYGIVRTGPNNSYIAAYILILVLVGPIVRVSPNEVTFLPVLWSAQKLIRYSFILITLRFTTKFIRLVRNSLRTPIFMPCLPRRAPFLG